MRMRIFVKNHFSIWLRIVNSFFFLQITTVNNIENMIHVSNTLAQQQQQRQERKKERKKRKKRKRQNSVYRKAFLTYLHEREAML